MQWAYSELFQNYSGQQVAGYLDHSFRQSRRVGLLVHYSETHDNERLAAKGRAWSLLRNRLCALASVNGGFGFTCGVEWLAAEKIRVHGCSGMAWDNPVNLVPELARLNSLLAEHPCFFDGASQTRLSATDSPIYALLRQSAEAEDRVLVLVNTDPDHAHGLALAQAALTHPVPGQAAEPVEPARPARPTPCLPLPQWLDLLGQAAPQIKPGGQGALVLTLPPGAAFCLAPTPLPRGLHGNDYRQARARAAFGLSALNQVLPLETVGELDWRTLAAAVDRSPERFLALVSHLAGIGAQAEEIAQAISGAAHGVRPSPGAAPTERASALECLTAALDPDVVAPGDGRTPVRLPAVGPVSECASAGAAAPEQTFYPRVVTWQPADLRRITLAPPAHWLLLRDAVPFRAALDCHDDAPPRNVESIPVRDGHIACLAPRQDAADATLLIERYTGAGSEQHIEGAVRFLASAPDASALGLRVCELDPVTRARRPSTQSTREAPRPLRPTDLVLLTNGRGGMARLCLDLGRVNSKYDCVLGANLHPSLPVDRHVLAKRIRVWVNADGFISPLDFRSLAAFQPGPPAVWQFIANAGDGRTVEIQMTADMLQERNTTVFHFSRPTAAQATGKQLPAQAEVRLTVRLDIEDRNFHWETRRNGSAEDHLSSHLDPVFDEPAGAPAAPRAKTGFAFTPAADRQLRVFADAGAYHPEPEWSQNIPHPLEQSRGQTGSGDAFSPGWFDLPLPKGGKATLVVTAEPADPDQDELESSRFRVRTPLAQAPFPTDDAFGQQLLRAARDFVVRRGQGKTIIAGYPWFLDWGRDTFICARGLLAAGMVDEVRQITLTFARFEKDGTLPNTIFGDDASNRDTSDAPLWFGVVCEEIAELAGSDFYQIKAGPGDTTIAEVLWDIALHYAKGTPNGIRMDPASGLIWSPKHFTWMDTNYPAGTPREGYPVEIQALWIRLLRQLDRLGGRAWGEGWKALAERALDAAERFYWLEERGYYADLLAARPGQSAADAVVDDALRSNCLFLASLGLAGGARAQRCVEAARRYLVVPGGLRSLAPLPVTVPLPIYGKDGRLLNNPAEPYWARYEGDEDTGRKPAYHNGTAWTWTFPVFCEALARAWDFSSPAVAAARAYLGSLERLMAEGCLGHIPEVLDGDAPHTQRGCDAQAWGATEALRVWKLLANR